MHEVKPTSTLIAGLGKKVIPVRGEIKLPIKFANMEMYHTFIVCDNLDNEFIIGIDVLRKFGIQIDIPNKKIYTSYGESGFLDKPVSIKSRMKIRCNKTITLPANSVCYISGKIPICNTKLSYEGVLEPYHKLAENSGLFTTPALSYSNGNVIPIHCINVMPHEVTIYRNQLIAFIEPFEKLENVEGVYRIRNDTDFYDATMDIPRIPGVDPVDITVKQGKWDNPQELLKQLRIDEIAIPEDSKQQLRDLITEYSHCFSRNKFDLGEASFYKAKINLKHDYVAKWVPSRPIAYKLQPYMDEHIENLTKSGQISRCSYSLWNCPVFLVGKPNAGGTRYRFVVDARSLNAQCIQDNFELPRINNILDKMSECNYLSTFDFTSSFTQIGLEKSSQPLTAFTYNGKRYMWNRLVMGQTSSSAQFSRSMAQLFSKVPFKSLLIYVDDIVLGSMSVSEHLKRLRFVFERLTWGNLKLSPMKTHLLQREVRFLGHKLSNEGLRMDQSKVEAIQKIPAPTSVKQLQKFLGVINYHRSFIKGFAEIASPLYELLKKKVSFNWSKDCQDSFEKLKSALTSSDNVLALPDVSDPLQSYQLAVDSSKRGQGATLSQIVNGKRRIVSYWSRAVPKHLQKLGATRLEFLALHGSIKHFRLYLQSTKFVVLTDCRALLSLQTIFNNENSYMQRRLADLAGFNFEIRHVSGRSESIQMPDFLSRYAYENSVKDAQTQTGENPKSPLHKVLTLSDADKSTPITLDEIKSEYVNDTILTEVLKWVRDGKKPAKLSHRNNPAELCHYWKKFDLLKQKDGILYYTWVNVKDRAKDDYKIVVPYTLVEKVLYTYHSTIDSCHSGVEASLKRCKKRFYFYSMRHEFQLYIGSCITCARNKQCKAFLKAPLKPIVYTEFGQGIAIDHLEPSKKATARGAVALLTIVDMFSKLLVCVPVTSTGTEESVRVVLEHWILKHGMPETILHDLGSGFTSALFKTVMKVFGIKDTKTTSYYSQGNGLAEAYNRKINQCMRVCLTDKQYQSYDLWVKYIVFTLNGLVSNRTGFTPNFLTYGRELRMPRDLFIKDDDRIEKIRSEISDNDYKRLQAYNLYKQVSEVTRKVRDNAQRRAKYFCKQYDKKVRGPYFNTGDLCYLLVTKQKHKYADKWSGPFLVTEKINDWNYIVDVNDLKKVVNISKMKVCNLTKYSEPDLRSFHENANKNSSHDVTDKNKTVRKRQQSADSSDDDVIIVSHDPFEVGKRVHSRRTTRTRGLRSSGGMSKPAGDSDTAENSAATIDISDPESASAPEQLSQSVDSSSAPEHVPEIVAQPELDTSATSDQDFFDTQEALEDANKSLEHEVTNSVDDSTPSHSFRNIDNLNITLSDIREHEKSRGLNTSTTGSGAAQDLDTVHDLSRSSGRYDLRSKPKKANRFGFAISPFKKKRK